MEEVASDSVVKDYILNSRKAGFSDSAIADSLRGAGWPEEIINKAIKDTSAPLPAAKAEPSSSAKEKKPEVKEGKGKEDPEKKDELFTKPEIMEQPEQETKKEEPKKDKKSFCILALISLIFSPVPFIGLGIAMAALESAAKHKQTGAFLAVLALIINIGVIGFIAFILYQIFTLPVDNLTGFSKYVVDTFQLM